MPNISAGNGTKVPTRTDAARDAGPELLSKAELAVRLGVKRSAVSNWIARGKLRPPALRPDGSVNVALAKRQLGIITRAEIRMADEIDRGQAAGEVARQDSNRGVRASDTSTTLGDLGVDRQRLSEWREIRDAGEGAGLRDQLLMVELERKQRQLEAAKGTYVLASQVRAERGQALAQMISAIDNWVPEMVAELGLDRDQLGRVKASWRKFRERQAEAMLAEAMALPEMLKK